MAGTAERARAFQGPALFSFGFRPFFLFAAVWAALAAPTWAWMWATGAGPALGGSPLAWHMHEMLFGVIGAIVAGFLLTAVPNWTGRLPVTGWPLAALAGLWLAGRVAMLAAGPLGWIAGAIDAAFPIALAAVIWREVVAGRNTRNLPVAGLVAGLALASIGFHAFVLSGGDPFVAVRGGLAVVAGLIALIGGRITPSFTRNWLVKQGRAAPASPGRFDRGALGLAGLGLAAWVAAPDHAVSGALLLAGGAATLARLARWRVLATLSEPLVWILHAGYAWLAASLILLGVSSLWPELAPRSAGVHALTAGAMGVMTLAVMTRATRGHTGRALAAGPATLAIYLLVNAGALIRVAGGFAAPGDPVWIGLSAGLWAGAYALFALVYAPMLARPRLRAH